MPRFIATFSTTSGKSQLHDAGCSIVANRRKGTTHAKIEAADAYAAVQEYRSSEESDARGLPRTTVCDCALKADAARRGLTIS